MEAGDFTKEVPLHDAIMYLKDNLKQEWRDVGRHLGLSESDIVHINSDYPGNTKEKCYQMLKKWEEVSGSEATVSILADALKKSGRSDLTDLLITGKLPVTYTKKKQVCSPVAKEKKKRDPKRRRLGKILEPVIRYFLVAAGGYLICLSRTNMKISATESSQFENNTCPSARPMTVQRLIDGTLAFMDGVGKIEAHWQKFSAGKGRHSLVMGKPAAGDKLLYEEKIRKGYCCYFFPIFRQRHTFRYNCSENELMTSVIVEDGWDDGTGGNPEIKAGGLRDCHVEIMVTSRMGRGMDFAFHVFGRKDEN